MNRFTAVLKETEAKVVKFFTHISKAIIAITIVLALFNSIDSLLTQSFTIHPFNVPTTLSSNGVTGSFVAWQLSDEISAIQKTGWSVSGLSLSNVHNDKIEEDIIFFGVSFNSLKSLIRNILNIKDKAIGGSIAIKGERLHLKIKIYSADSIVITKDVKQFDNIYDAYDQAIQSAAFEVLKEVDPFVLASFYWANEETKKSVNIIKHMIRNRADNLDSAYLLWGEMLTAEQKYQQAIIKFKKSTQINPKNYLAWNAWGWTLSQTNSNDKDAISKFEKAIEIEPELWSAWFHWGQLLLKKQKYQDAISKFEEAIKTDASRFEAYNEMSYALKAEGKIDSAISYLLEGIENAPDTGLLYATLAEKYWLKNEKEKAFMSLHHSLEQGFDVYQYTNSEPYKTFSQVYPN